jgi:UDP-N-acetyl-2-amino-2-deoxyglucuronate dehydrogenase
MKNFALIGASGYIAPRHLKAIKETGNNLVCALDPYDGIGIMDSFFPYADFFTETEKFDSHIDNLRRFGQKIDYISVCSPNYLHEAHIRMALRNDVHVICEKPLVLNINDLDLIQEIEMETDKKVYSILQLRLHPSIQELKRKVEEGPVNKVYEVDLDYITSRGKWYFTSWKGNQNKSGGVASNIGVHFFDMLGWIFGDFKGVELEINKLEKAGGKLYFEKANVNWFLSVDEHDLPNDAIAVQKRTYRKINIEGHELEFSDGFTDLHTISYKNILNGLGFGIEDTRKCIQIVTSLQNIKF